MDQPLESRERGRPFPRRRQARLTKGQARHEKGRSHCRGPTKPWTGESEQLISRCKREALKVSLGEGSDERRAAGAPGSDETLPGERDGRGLAEILKGWSREEDRQRQPGSADPQLVETPRTNGAGFFLGRLKMGRRRRVQRGARVGAAPASSQTVMTGLSRNVQIQGSGHQGDRQETNSEGPVHEEHALGSLRRRLAVSKEPRGLKIVPCPRGARQGTKRAERLLAGRRSLDAAANPGPSERFTKPGDVEGNGIDARAAGC